MQVSIDKAGQQQPAAGEQPLEEVDEGKEYLDARFIGSTEACHKLFGFKMHTRYPAVYQLEVHTPNGQTVTLRPGDLQRCAGTEPPSRLEGWFKLNTSAVGLDTNSTSYLYHEIPEHYSWDASERTWVPRTKNVREPTVGRMWYVHPNGEDKERYFLRLLLTIRPGMKSWEDCRTVDSRTYATFKEACDAST
eukprot:363160-Chlamydomonas_euryale.AAC.2